MAQLINNAARTWTARIVVVAGLAIVIALVLATLPASAGAGPKTTLLGVQPTEVNLGGQPNDCAAAGLDHTWEFRIENPQTGTYMDAVSGTDITLDVASNDKTFDFTASRPSNPAPITGVVVKGGKKSTVFDYLNPAPGSDYLGGPTGADDGLHAPTRGGSRLYSVSHVSLCITNRVAPTLTTDVGVAALSLEDVDFITDTATLTGPNGEIDGSVIFTAYSDESCTTVAFTGSSVVGANSGNVTVQSPQFTEATHGLTTGTYYWIASYSGGTNYLPVSGACGDANETVEVFEYTIPCGESQIDIDPTLGLTGLFWVTSLDGQPCIKLATIDFSQVQGEDTIIFEPSGLGNVKFVGEVTFDTDETPPPDLELEVDFGDGTFSPIDWTSFTPDASKPLGVGDFTCPNAATRPWCVLEATVIQDEVTFKLGGTGDPRLKFG